MSATGMPDRIYTPWQRRQAVIKIAAQKDITLMEAAVVFEEMESASPTKFNEFVNKFDVEVTN